MKKPQDKIPTVIRYWYRSRLAVVIESVIIGFLVGFVIVLFRYLLEKADGFRQWLYGTLAVVPFYWTVIWAAVLVCVGLFLGWASKQPCQQRIPPGESRIVR
jgi:H+/Cl- antiporter ClcA